MGLFGRPRPAPAREAAELPPLRLAAAPQAGPPELATTRAEQFHAPPPVQALELVADKDGARRVHLRLFSRDGAFIVESEAKPEGALVPRRPGPYRFQAHADAVAFFTEAAQALAYLGCHVSNPLDLPAEQPAPEPAHTL